jgi:hypothetical protein
MNWVYIIYLPKNNESNLCYEKYWRLRDKLSVKSSACNIKLDSFVKTKQIGRPSYYSLSVIDDFIVSWCITTRGRHSRHLWLKAFSVLFLSRWASSIWASACCGSTAPWCPHRIWDVGGNRKVYITLWLKPRPKVIYSQGFCIVRFRHSSLFRVACKQRTSCWGTSWP